MTLPNGVIATVPTRKMREPLRGNRHQWFSYHLQTSNGAPAGDLAGVTGGRLEWHANAQVKGGGTITINDSGPNDVPWLKRRVKIVMHIDGLGEFPLGVFIPSAPKQQWTDTGLTLEVELLDKTSIIANVFTESSFSLAKGTVITEAVRDLIVSCGEKAGSVTHTTDTLAHAMTWEAGTSKLKIINDLLAAGNFWALKTDGNGHFKVSKHRKPSKRAVVFHFVDDGGSIYTPDFGYEKDHYSVPNKVILIGQGDGDKKALKSVATNENPKSKYSYQSRGYWIVDVQTGVEASSQEVLDDMAKRRLAQLTSPTGLLEFAHAPLPTLNVNDVVTFKRRKFGIEIKGTVSSMQIDLDPTALSVTQIQEVAEL